MKLRIFSRTIISTSIDRSYNCNSVSNDCGFLGIHLGSVGCYSELLNYWMWDATEKAHNFILKKDTLFVMEMQVIVIQTIIAWHGFHEVVQICNFIIFIAC